MFYEALGDRARIMAWDDITPVSLVKAAGWYPDRTIYVLTLQHGVAPHPGLEEVRAFALPTQDRGRSWTHIYRFGPNRCATPEPRPPG